MLENIKLILRISENAYDEEIQGLIDSAVLDLKLSGVQDTKFQIDTSGIYEDALVKRAIQIYCKANFGYDDKQDKYMDAFNSLKRHLTLSVDYVGDASA